MAVSLSVKKGILTRNSNLLLQMLAKYAIMAEDAEMGTFGERNDRVSSIQEAEVEVKTLQAVFEKALFAFTEAVDKLENPISKEEEAKISEYTTSAEETLAQTEKLLIGLEVQKQRLASHDHAFFGTNGPTQRGNPMSRVELPKIPIPEFSGKSWQWDSFWELFNATVHSLPLSDLQKFNYLLRALKGEARESISRFQVSSANYSLAVAHLKERYGNIFNIVTGLHRQLEQLNSRSSQLRDQRKLFDQLSAIISQLESKGESLESPWLLSKILNKFSDTVQRRTLREKVNLPQTENWSMDKLITTLENVIKQEEEIEQHMPRKFERAFPNPKTGKEGERTYFTPKAGHDAHFQERKRSPFCFYCDSKEHWSTGCTKVTSPKERLEHLKKSNRCIGCGSKTHSFAECKSRGCMKCGKKHHTSTCFKATPNADVASPSSTATPDRKKTTKQRPSHARQNFAMCQEEETLVPDSEPPDLTVMRVEDTSTAERQGEIFLLTGTMQALHPRTKKLITLRILLDTGADRSFIDANLLEELDLPTNGITTMKLRTFGAENPREIQCIDTCLDVWDSEGTNHTLHVYTHDSIVKNFREGTLGEDDLQFIRSKRIKMSIPHEGKKKPPEVLIGCDQLWKFINFEAPHFTLPSGLILVPTRLGYMVSGQRIMKKEELQMDLHSSVHTIDSYGDSDPWENHWNVQPYEVDTEYSGPEKEERAQINEQVLQNFNNSIERRSNGYTVRLPLKEEHKNLPDNRAIAVHRLRSILSKYRHQPEILQQYHGVFQDQINKNIIEEVDESQDEFGKMKHYLPHQPVITPQKDTTKFRVVFDASAHYKNCPSLNEVVHQGPTILPKLYGILLRFRVREFVLLSDVEKAFLQVHLHENDRDFTRCIWVKDVTMPLTEDNMAVYRFTRVTFGINASPFLLSATILFHLNNYVTDKALAHEIASNLYVDNLFVGAKSIREALKKYTDLKSVFNELGMNLRAFVSNNPEIMRRIWPTDRSLNTAPKVLGTPWDSETDEFSLIAKIHTGPFISKRTIAQQIAAVYDPLGFLIPLLVKAKHFQQFLWKEHYEWDEPLKENHRQQWMCIASNINDFHQKVPRKIAQESETFTLVTYSDASGIAMTACTYLTSDHESSFLMAKSRVADTKRIITIPKMEMNAVTIAARLTLNVFLSLKSTVNINQIMFLTDSEIVLKWMKAPVIVGNAGPYITNRVKEVHRIVETLETMGVEVLFGHIDTKWNPADIGTRGASSEDFSTHVWWKGYPLNRILQNTFTSTFFSLPKEVIFGEEKECLPSVHVNSSQSSEQKLDDILNLTSYSSKKKSIRILAYVIKFLKNITARLQEPLRRRVRENLPYLDKPCHGQHLTASDLLEAHHVLVKNHQTVHLTSQYMKNLTKSLNMKADEEHLFRAYGRLNKSDLNSLAKNPVVIVPNTELCRLIVLEAHGRYHNSIGHTIAEVRQQYWIPRLREQVKKCIRSCVACQKMNNLPYKYPEMTDLPAFRVRRSRPFHHVGLDYFGPISIFEENRERTEVHGCIFTCCVTRLIHLEVVSDGTTEKFLNAFRRFIARRGRPCSVTCDNAPTFILGSEIVNSSIKESSAGDELMRTMGDLLIEWRHITPYSPWQGGFYERLIKTVKQALFKAIGRRTLTREQLCTFLTEIEGCINSRPLTYQENDIDDGLSPLRPIDFIQRDMDLSLPLNFSEEEEKDPTYLPSSEALRLETRSQTLNALRSSYSLTERYWTIWKDQYLTALREQHRQNIDDKRGCTKEVCEGDVVLLNEPFQKRIYWKLGRILKLVPSSDGAVREVEVSCNKKTLRRPINQLIPLEIEGNLRASVHTRSYESPQPDQSPSSSHTRYNLRPRKNDYHNRNSPLSQSNLQSTSTVHCLRTKPSTSTWPLSVYLKMALALVTVTVVNAANFNGQVSENKTGRSSTDYAIECRKQGVYIHAPELEEYELCTYNYCIIGKTPPVHEIVRLPAEELLYDYEVRWKIRRGQLFTILETKCPAQPFCSAIDCTLCASNILNPECWPITAIAGFGITLYLVVAICYTVCCVPVTIGHPCRLILTGVCEVGHLLVMLVKACTSRCWRMLRRTRRRPTKILQALAIVGMLQGITSCQVENIFSHHLHNCELLNEKRICNVEIASVVKINPFKREACMTLQRNASTVMKVRLRWEGVKLLCDRIPLTYTRNVVQNVIDSKRCPHMGSCIGNKCADVNTTILLPELAVGNAFPGVTGCMESCGGPGCDCFYLSSGCLFYRIYAVPKDDDVYEIFKCIKWRERVKLRLLINQDATLRSYVLSLSPNVPNRVQNMEITLSMLSTPPLPMLEQEFIKTRNRTALWKRESQPILSCPSPDEAKSLQCIMRDECKCASAESQVMCKCEDDEVSASFMNIGNVLPTSKQLVKFSVHSHHGVMATTDQDVSAEIILNIKGKIDDFTTEIRNDICTIGSTHLSGCYHCSRGASATVKCFSTFKEVSAEVECDNDSFSIPCTPEGAKSQLNFLLQSARIRMQCSVKCGLQKNTFEITGILKYVHNLRRSIMHYVNQHHNQTSEIHWPDIGHIFDIYVQWYKTLLLTTAVVAAALLLSYMYLMTAGGRLVKLCITSMTKCFLLACHLLWSIICLTLNLLCMRKKKKTTEKLL